MTATTTPDLPSAWMLFVHPDAGTHVTTDVDIRDRWLDQYGEGKVFRLSVGAPTRKPSVWRYRLKGNVAWHYYEGEAFDLPEPEAYEFHALYQGDSPAATGMAQAYQAVIAAARAAVAIGKDEAIPRGKFPLSHNRPMHEKARPYNSLIALESALDKLDWEMR